MTTSEVAWFSDFESRYAAEPISAGHLELESTIRKGLRTFDVVQLSCRTYRCSAVLRVRPGGGSTKEVMEQTNALACSRYAEPADGAQIKLKIFCPREKRDN
jgi:hypothetical protein